MDSVHRVSHDNFAIDSSRSKKKQLMESRTVCTCYRQSLLRPRSGALSQVLRLRVDDHNCHEHIISRGKYSTTAVHPTVDRDRFDHDRLVPFSDHAR